MNNSGIGRGAQVIGVAVCSLCLTWISVGLRFYVRLGIRRFGNEDWLTAAAMILFTVLCSLFLEVINYGLGWHLVNIPIHDVPIGLKYIFVCELLYVATTAMTKMSIGVYFLRLSSKRYQRCVIYTVMAVVMVISTTYFFFLLFQCHPVSYLWTYYYGSHGYCISKNTLANVTYAHSAMSAVTDWAFGILPVFFVMKIKMNRRTKISVTLVLSLGFFASTATLVRIYYIRRLVRSDDIPYEAINLVKWSMVEPAIGITAAAIATLRPLFNTSLFRCVFRHNPTTFHHSQLDKTRGSLDYSSGKESFSAEFAEMLGLSPGGTVTTTITAGTDIPEMRKKRKWVKSKKPKSSPLITTSQTELNGNDSDESTPSLDWSTGIIQTTVVTTEAEPLTPSFDWSRVIRKTTVITTGAR